MLGTLMEKADNMQDMVDNVKREMKILKKKKKRPKINTAVIDVQDAIDRLFSRLDTARKESLHLRILQQKLPKMNNKEKKD